ncbi:MAG: hypothetical protein FWF24_01420 [Alphaproteobacteria bacterium]|nr:hypothetical protein [Alphaproteobacteria bacterium]
MTLTTRPLFPTDAAALDAFLAPCTVMADIIRAEAQVAGLVYEGRPLEAEYFGAFEGQRLVGVLSYSWANKIRIYAENPDSLPLLAQAARTAIVKRGGLLEAVDGPTLHVDAVIAALALPPDVFRGYREGGNFRLDLENLRLPALPEDPSLRLAEEKDRALLIDGRMAFNMETKNVTSTPEIKASIEKEVDLRLKNGWTFMLEKAGALVSFCGIESCVSGVVIIGPVFTFMDLRNQGYGRAVAGYGLKTLMQEYPDLRTAVLSASRPDAIRTYESLGFRRTADWCSAILKEGSFFLSSSGLAQQEPGDLTLG